MLEQGRIDAVIELLEDLNVAEDTLAPQPADIVLNRYFKARRYIGSKDRGAIAELTYFIIRHRGTLSWWTARTGLSSARALVIAALSLAQGKRPAELAALFVGDKFAPARLSHQEAEFARHIAGQPLLHPEMPDHARLNYPLWLEAELKQALGAEWKEELTALAQEAPVDLRVNTLRATREELLRALTQEQYDVTRTPLSPLGVRMRKRAPIFTSPRFKEGWFEMQDEGSQLVSLALNAKPGEKIIDFCAGAGGKTLAIAAQMQNKGRVLAWDVSDSRLEQMTPRLKRAHVDNVQRHVLTSEQDAFIKRHKDSADAVLIDAPCSGTGTWRRNPDLKWRTTRAGLDELTTLQSNILTSAARLVKKGGRLLYVTCSLLRCENAIRIEKFLETHPNFRVVLMENLWNKSPQPITNNSVPATEAPNTQQGGPLHLTPYRHGTDGFFASLLERFE